MATKGRSRRAAALAIATAVLLGAGAASAQVPDTFKNLKIFPKDISKAHLMDAMKGFSTGLGVRCTHCHVGEEKVGAPPFADFKFDADDRAPKTTARAMMKMVSDLNSKYLSKMKTGREQKVQVDCMTCHRGVAIPQPIGQLTLDTIHDQGIDAGIAKYRELRQRYQGTMAYNFGEEPLNDVARVLEADRKQDDAIAIIKLNAEFHPKAARVFFKLGELYLGKGDKTAAADAYRKALEIDPDLGPAKKRLAEVTTAGG
jgi:tetratricopeptide (TPR) repeat protein